MFTNPAGVAAEFLMLESTNKNSPISIFSFKDKKKKENKQRVKEEPDTKGWARLLEKSIMECSQVISAAQGSLW